MEPNTEPPLELLFSFYERLHRKGPGSETSTRRALAMLTGLPAEPRIIDFGCGSGAAALVLAKATGGHVTALDIHRPFLSDLNARAMAVGLSDRTTTIQADMANPPLPEGSFDLIWSEGAIYLIGFEAGLRRWRRLLRPGGFIAVTEITWLSPQPPAEALEFWSAAYPAMTTIEQNLASLRSAGFEALGHFVLPREDWANFYEPLQVELRRFREEHAGDEAAQAYADQEQQEVDLWKRCGDSYGYVFYLGRTP